MPCATGTLRGGAVDAEDLAADRGRTRADQVRDDLGDLVITAAVTEHLTGRLSAEERGILRLGAGAQLSCAKTAVLTTALTTKIAHGNPSH